MIRHIWLLPLLAFPAGSPARAHGPHEPKARAVDPAPAAAPIPLPAGWVESRVPAGGGALAPQLFADGDGFLATWIEPAPGKAPGVQRVRAARFDGKFWTFPATVRESATLFANWADVPGIVRAADGTLYAWWLERSSSGTYTYDVALARSTDQGVTFAQIGILHDDRSPAEHGFVSAVREREGVRFYYLDGRMTPGDQPMQLRTVFVEARGSPLPGSSTRVSATAVRPRRPRSPAGAAPSPTAIARRRRCAMYAWRSVRPPDRSRASRWAANRGRSPAAR